MPTVPGTLAGVDARLLQHAGKADKLLIGLRKHRAQLAKSTTASAADLAQLDRAIHDLEETVGAVRYRAHGVHGLDDQAARTPRGRLAKALGDPEQPGHKYVRREWDAAANHWKYIYHADKHSSPHHFTLTHDEVEHHGAALVDKHQGDVVGAALEAVDHKPHVSLTRERAKAMHAVVEAHERWSGGGTKLPELVRQMQERAHAAKQGTPLDPLEHSTNAQLESMFHHADRKFRATLESMGSDEGERQLWEAVNEHFRARVFDYQWTKPQRQHAVKQARAIAEYAAQAAEAIKAGRPMPPGPEKAKPAAPAAPAKLAPTNLGAKVTPQLAPAAARPKPSPDAYIRHWFNSVGDFDPDDLADEPRLTQRETDMIHGLGMVHLYYSPNRPISGANLRYEGKKPQAQTAASTTRSRDAGFVYLDRALSEKEVADNEFVPISAEARSAVGLAPGENAHKPSEARPMVREAAQKWGRTANDYLKLVRGTNRYRETVAALEGGDQLGADVEQAISAKLRQIETLKENGKGGGDFVEEIQGQVMAMDQALADVKARGVDVTTPPRRMAAAREAAKPKRGAAPAAPPPAKAPAAAFGQKAPKAAPAKKKQGGGDTGGGGQLALFSRRSRTVADVLRKARGGRRG